MYLQRCQKWKLSWQTTHKYDKPKTIFSKNKSNQLKADFRWPFECAYWANSQRCSCVFWTVQSAFINKSILKVLMRQTTMTSTCAVHATLMREASLWDTYAHTCTHTQTHTHIFFFQNTIGIDCNRQFEWEAGSSTLLATLLTRATINTDSTQGGEEAASALLRNRYKGIKISPFSEFRHDQLSRASPAWSHESFPYLLQNSDLFISWAEHTPINSATNPFLNSENRISETSASLQCCLRVKIKWGLFNKSGAHLKEASPCPLWCGCHGAQAIRLSPRLD